MVSTATSALLPQGLLTEAALLSPASEVLRQTLCRLSPITVDRNAGLEASALSVALEQLIEITMRLLTPTLGRPLEAASNPQALAPYLSDEVWELLDSLDAWPANQLQAGLSSPPDVTLPIPSLIPHLLWMLASSGYEVMHLIEGVRARLYEGDSLVAVRVIRLVPVLVLTTERGSYALDLVTQASPLPSRYLASATALRLVENDLDNQLMRPEDLLAHILALTHRTQPILHNLLEVGREVRVLIPCQPWQCGTLRLHLYLADTGLGTSPDASKPADASPAVFTLDDFANTLADPAECTAAGILGYWLTFTDEDWIHQFLSSYAQQVMRQGLWQQTKATTVADERELNCVALAYDAVSLVHGPNALFKHTFVHEPALVADVWPRLRWYLAQSSERIMQLMGGLQAQVLCPGCGWQPGTLHLRSLLHLVTPTETWLIDLSTGKLLLIEPSALPADAVLETTDTAAWANHHTMAELEGLVSQDLAQHAPAMAALGQGTDVNLHCLESKEGYQAARLSLSWRFTWA